MNNEQLNKHAKNKIVRFWPPASRFDGRHGRELEDQDYKWKISDTSKIGLHLINASGTPHGFWLNRDEFTGWTSAAPGEDCDGFLTLKVQLAMGGDHVWRAEPLNRPGLSNDRITAKDAKQQN